MDRLEAPEITYCQDKGKNLPQDCRQSSTENAPVKGKDEKRVEDGIDNGFRNHAGHGIPGTSLRPDQIAHSVCYNKKGHSGCLFPR